MDKFTLGLGMTAIGLGTVFFVLLLLQAMMNLLSFVTNNFYQKRLPQKQVTKSVSDVSNTNPEIVAAIMGALALVTGQPLTSLRLVAVRKLSDSESKYSWDLHGRAEIINSRTEIYTQGGLKQ